MKKGGVPWVNDEIRPFLTQEDTPREERYDNSTPNPRGFDERRAERDP